MMVTAAAGFKHIITKAVYARQTAAVKHQVELQLGGGPRPVAVLGHVVANPRIVSAEVTGSASGNSQSARVTGAFDLHVWYRTDEDTRVARQSVQFAEDVPVRPTGGESFRDLSAAARLVGRPECGAVELVGASAAGAGRVFRTQVKLDVEVEVMGTAELNVSVVTKGALPTPPAPQPIAPAQVTASKEPVTASEAASPGNPIGLGALEAADEDDVDD